MRQLHRQPHPVATKMHLHIPAIAFTDNHDPRNFKHSTRQPPPHYILPHNILNPDSITTLPEHVTKPSMVFLTANTIIIQLPDNYGSCS